MVTSAVLGDPMIYSALIPMMAKSSMMKKPPMEELSFNTTPLFVAQPNRAEVSSTVTIERQWDRLVKGTFDTKDLIAAFKKEANDNSNSMENTSARQMPHSRR